MDLQALEAGSRGHVVLVAEDVDLVASGEQMAGEPDEIPFRPAMGGEPAMNQGNSHGLESTAGGVAGAGPTAPSSAQTAAGMVGADTPVEPAHGISMPRR